MGSAQVERELRDGVPSAGGPRPRVLLWNVWNQVEAARRLIAEPDPFSPEALVGRLPEAPNR